MACLLNCPRGSGKGSVKTDLSWSFSMVAFFLLSFSSFPLLFYDATPCVLLLVFNESAESFVAFLYGSIFILRYYIVCVCPSLCTNPL